MDGNAVENPNSLKTHLEDVTGHFIAESIKFHREAVEALRRDYMSLQGISRINQNPDKYQELFCTVEEAANYHKTKIREILHGQFDFS